MADKLSLESLSKKEKKDYSKKLREDQSGKEKRTTLFFSVAIVTLLLAAALGIFTLVSSKNSDLPKELGEKIAVDPKTGELHIKFGEDHVPYNSNPPTSGPHYNIPGVGPIECKFFDKEVLDEGVIHNLEHGAIWISYKNNDNTLEKELKEIQTSNSKIVVTYRPKNDSFIAVAGWGRLLKLSRFDKTKIEQFIKLYKNGPDVPEPLAGCGTKGMKSEI